MAAVRDAKAADLPAIIALLAADQLGQGREQVTDPVAPCYLAAFEAIAADPNNRLLVVMDGKDVVGTFQLSFLPGLSRSGSWRGQVEAVRIAASHRGAGLGTRVFEWAIEACRQRGCALVQLTTDRSRPDAHRFYERLGFEPSHVGFKLQLPPP